jgi:hypothetical protein
MGSAPALRARQGGEPHRHSKVCEEIELSGEEATMVESTLAKALKVKNRLAGRLAKAQADIQASNSIYRVDERTVRRVRSLRAE